MAALTEKIKIHIVQSLACYMTPQQVSLALKNDFGLDVPRQQVQAYDPSKVIGRSLSKPLADLFYETREKFKASVMDIPVAQQAYRLMTLQQLINKNLDRGNDVLVMDLLKQGAQDVGNVFTNKQLLGADAENPLLLFYKQISGRSLPVVPDDELEEEVFDGEIISFNTPVKTEIAKAIKIATDQPRQNLFGRD